MLAWRLAKSVEVSLNQVLSRSGEVVDLSWRHHTLNNYWNVTLLEDPIFAPEYISFVLDGSFFSGSNLIQKNGVERAYDFPRMPVFVGTPDRPV